MMKHLLLPALLAHTLTPFAQGQWQLSQQHTTTFNGVYGLDAQHLWLSGYNGEFFRSTDGGVQLDSFKIPDNYSIMNDIAVRNDSLVFIGGGCYFTFDQCPGDIVLRTDTSGTGWQISMLDTSPFSIGVVHQFDLHPDGQIFALSDYSGIFHSPDLGATWTPVPAMPAASLNTYSALQFLDNQTGYVLGTKYHQANDYSFRLFKTVNGGQDWTMVLEIPSTDIINQRVFHFLNTETGFVPGDAGILYRTTDGGQTWTEQQVGSADEYLQRIQFAGNQTGYLSTLNATLWQSRIYRSTDGGQNWSVDLQVDTAYFSDLHFYEPNGGYAVTPYGHIYERTVANSTKERARNQTVKVYPNPAYEFTTLQYILKQTEIVSIRLLDLQGKVVHTILENELRTSGVHQHTIALPANLPAGLYSISITTGNGTTAVRLVKQGTH